MKNFTNLKEKMVNLLKNRKVFKKFDPISFALVVLLGASAVFSGIQIFGNRGNEVVVNPPVANGDDLIVVDNQRPNSDNSIPTNATTDENGVVKLNEVILSPLGNVDVEFTTRYYDDAVEASVQTQRFFYFKAGNSLYTQESKGISLKSTDDEKADVISSLSGTVVSVKDEILNGTVVTIEHDNNIKTVYYGVYDVKVSQGDKIAQGDVIGSTGLSQREPDAGNVIHFEIIKDDVKINPETSIEKNVNEL
ncbi:MAG: peptidoglycan DD-metalloendopeptidase family protein [Turicibacter sp.]